MKYPHLKKIVFLASGVLVVATPLLVSYAAPLVQCSGDACRACDVAQLMKTMIAFLRDMGAIIGTIVFMWAGFKLVTAGGNSESVTYAKGVFINVIIGVFLMFSGYLIVNTLMQMLVGNTFFKGANWAEVECTPNTTINKPDMTGTFGGANPVSSVNIAASGNKVATADEAAVIQQLKNSGVTFAPGITPVGLDTGRLAELAGMAKDCAAAMGQDCGVRITSGVRYPGGATIVGAHGNGYAIDVTGRSEVFNSWMNSKSGFTTVASFNGNTAKVIPGSNAKCTWEAPDKDSTAYHWHCQP